MKSMCSGMKNLWFNICNFLAIPIKNCKIELSVIALSVFVINFHALPIEISQILKCYFSESRCAGIAGYSSVITGIYVTVWSIFATSASKINEELLKNKVEGQLFFLIAIGIIETFVTTTLSVFIPYSIPQYIEIILLSTILTTISFIKFVLILMRITKLNVRYIVKEIDDQQAKSTEIQVKIDEIYQKTVNKQK